MATKFRNLLLVAGLAFGVWSVMKMVDRDHPPLPKSDQAAPGRMPVVSSTPNTPVPATPPVPISVPGTAEQSMIDLDKIHLMFRDYRTAFGGNPVGSNAEIMKSLMGGNPKGAKFGPPEGLNLNSGGELEDHWGTPFFFHQLSGRQMEIRSAGPDKIMWTADDLIMK